MKRDGHIHTSFCPHGSKDSLDLYIERAIQLGFSHITFTEHAPLPKNFTDPAPERDSAMDWADLDAYFREMERVKQAYRKDIRIDTGFEVDYIEGFEQDTADFLTEYHNHIEDSILSVHFLPIAGGFVCLDFSEDEFGRMIQLSGSVEAVYQQYYDTVYRSIKADLGPFKPQRIGHITLVRKFQRMYACERSFDADIEAILLAVKEAGYALDYNGAGFVKPLCLETYPPASIAKQAHSLGIPLVYGSDAHAAAGIGQGFDQIDSTLLEGSGFHVSNS